ncbi:MAG: CcmD family protein [Bryobacteraceae bacterium]
MDSRNFAFMFYGFLAAWLILCAYVVSLASRERRLKREVERLRTLVEDKERTG